MEGIIDVHAHILPGVDDGSRSWEETRWMLWCAFSCGIRAVIATPHYSRRQDTERLRELAGQMQQLAHRISRDFQIYLGQEILYFNGLEEELEKKKALTLAGSRFVLVEFRPEADYGSIYQAMRRLLTAGYYPVAAHVERYRALREGGRLEELKEIGCLLQMNYHSLEGSSLGKNVRWCRKQVAEGRIDLLGTDAHRRDCRTPDISESLKWLEGRVQEQRLEKMTRGNVLRLLGARP